MVFRVLVAGSRSLVEYARLRDALDSLLANRLPAVEILTPGGPGVPALAASYAHSRGLPVVALTPDFHRRPGNAIEYRNALLIESADAVVVVWDAASALVRELLELARARGKAVRVLGGEPKRGKVVEPVEEPRFRGLPD